MKRFKVATFYRAKWTGVGLWNCLAILSRSAWQAYLNLDRIPKVRHQWKTRSGLTGTFSVGNQLLAQIGHLRSTSKKMTRDLKSSLGDELVACAIEHDKGMVIV